MSVLPLCKLCGQKTCRQKKCFFSEVGWAIFLPAVSSALREGCKINGLSPTQDAAHLFFSGSFHFVHGQRELLPLPPFLPASRIICSRLCIWRTQQYCANSGMLQPTKKILSLWYFVQQRFWKCIFFFTINLSTVYFLVLRTFCTNLPVVKYFMYFTCLTSILYLMCVMCALHMYTGTSVYLRRCVISYLFFTAYIFTPFSFVWNFKVVSLNFETGFKMQQKKYTHSPMARKRLLRMYTAH